MIWKMSDICSLAWIASKNECSEEQKEKYKKLSVWEENQKIKA